MLPNEHDEAMMWYLSLKAKKKIRFCFSEACVVLKLCCIGKTNFEKFSVNFSSPI